MNYKLSRSEDMICGLHFHVSPQYLTPIPCSHFSPSRSLNVIFFKGIFPWKPYWSPLGPYNKTTWTKLGLVTVTSLQSLLNVFGVPS